MPRYLQLSRWPVNPGLQDLCDSPMQVLPSRPGHAVVDLRSNQLVAEFETAVDFAQEPFVLEP